MSGNCKEVAVDEVGVRDLHSSPTSPVKTNQYPLLRNPLFWPAVAGILGFLYGSYDFAIGRTGEIRVTFTTATAICLIGLLWELSRRTSVAVYELSVLALSVGAYVGSHPTHPQQFRSFIYGWMIYAATGGILLCISKRGELGRTTAWQRLRIGFIAALVLQAGLVMAGFAQILLIEKRPQVYFNTLSNPLLESLALSVDGNVLASVGGIGPQLHTARLWDAQTGRKLAEIAETEVTAEPRWATVHFDGERMALAMRADGHTGSIASIAVFEVEKTEVIARVKWGDGIYSNRSAAFSNDGTEFVYSNFDGHLKVFDVSLGKVTVDLHRKGRPVHCIAVSCSRNTVACAVHPNSIEVWDLSNTRQIATLTSSAKVECMDFSPDGRLLACGTDAATVEVFDVAEQRRIVNIRGFYDGIISEIAFSPNGEALACGGSRGITVLIDTKSGAISDRLRMWGAWEIRALSFSGDGKQLATGNMRGHVAIWRLD